MLLFSSQSLVNHSQLLQGRVESKKKKSPTASKI
uniref:Uncharacterized protein n=1 Tax=Arundo donax TaxID=35708 RepID=A0A0A9GIK9_ARUDO